VALMSFISNPKECLCNIDSLLKKKILLHQVELKTDCLPIYGTPSIAQPLPTARTATGLICGIDTKIAMIALRRKQIFSVLWLVPKKSGFFRYVSFKLKKRFL